MTDPPIPMSAALRRKIRARRRNIPPSVRRRAAMQARTLLLKESVFIRSRRIAFYMGTEEEMDPGPAMETALALKKRCYLPIIPRGLLPRTVEGLVFQQFNPRQDRLAVNRYGILEPAFDPARLITPRMLDLVLVPLVAFDRDGNRLGMGKGFYDKTFAGLHKQWRRPVLLGMAYKLQQTEGLIARSWDVPLDGIVTEDEIVWPGPHAS